MPARRPAASFFCPTHPPVKPNAAYLVLIMVPYVLPLAMVEVREYLDRSGRSPFAVWSDRLNREAAVKVAPALARIQPGNFSNPKGVGAGVFWDWVDFCPDFPVYFCKNGGPFVI